MHVQPLQVDYWEARNKYLEYRAAVKAKAVTDPLGARKSDEEQLRRAFQAIHRGEKVIDIALAIEGGGAHPDGLPKLAIARADWTFVHTFRRDGYAVFAREERKWGRSGDQQFTHNVRVRLPLPPAVHPENVGGRAQVPMIPPGLRPAGELTYYRILFEAVWQRRPPVDPILLRHIGGPFYVVLAQWDLSPLEQSILRAKL